MPLETRPKVVMQARDYTRETDNLRSRVAEEAERGEDALAVCPISCNEHF